MELRSSCQGTFYLSLPWEALIGQGACSAQGDTSLAQNAESGIVFRLLISGFGIKCFAGRLRLLQHEEELFTSRNIKLSINSDMQDNFG